MTKTVCATLLALALATSVTGTAFAQTTPNGSNNATSGAPAGSNGGNSATGTGAAPSGK